MPTYEFRCIACEQQFEVFQSMSEPDPVRCKLCGVEGKLEKLLFPVAVHYKGSGFYSTDYSGSKPSEDKKSGAASDSSSEAKSSDSASNREKSSSDKPESTKSSDKSSSD